ncbi:MAG: hypothetical protein JNM44_10905, partial [Chitinophagaceae bacterium]|nr:hypothetical protein [Chitinophagaceae bacterium]
VDFENLKWSRYSESEIGFYYRHKEKKTKYFFGIWYDLWEKYEIPLSLCLSKSGNGASDWNIKLRKYISENYNDGIVIKEYDGWTCILFEYSFFKFDSGDDSKALSDMFYYVTEYADQIA